MLGWDRRAERPAYRSLARALEDAIARGEVRSGERLPPERKLAAFYGVSRGTVISAYDVLRDAGWLERQRGSGTFARRGGERRRTSPRNVAELVETAAPAVPPADVVNLTMSRPRASAELLQAALRAAATEVAELSHAVEYEAQGLQRLRALVAAAFERRGVPTDPSQIVVTSGTQQAISLAASVMMREGDSVIVESPTYLGALDVFRSLGANLVSVAAGHGTADLVALSAVARRSGPAALFLMPCCHAVTGQAFSAADKRAIAQLCLEVNLPLIEDDIFAELLIADDADGRPVASWAPDGPILTTGSLSKVFWNGLRLGWVRAPGYLVPGLVRAKAAADLGTSLVTQVVACELLAHAEATTRARREELVRCLGLAEELLAAQLPTWRWTRPRGAHSLWLQLPQPRATALAAVAKRHGVAVVPGTSVSADGQHEDHVELVFVQPEDALRRGIARLAAAWAALSSEVPSA